MTLSEKIYITLVLAVAIVYGALLGGRAMDSLQITLAGPSVQSPSAGQPRQVDMRTLEELIRRGTLSDHEARHYRGVEERVK